ncbi:hypothetical protein Tco_1519581 [Tanacetum coccineum]
MSESSESESVEMVEVDIKTLTMEQYLALAPGNQRPGVVRPNIRGNVNFEIKGQFLRELRDNTFSENKNDDAYEYVEKVLEISSLFSTLVVSNDAIMLRVFPLTLTGIAKRWMERVPSGKIYTWDLLKRASSSYIVILLERQNN